MGLKLVIVDDAPFICEVVKNLVQSYRIEVVGEAHNGLEAIEVVKKTQPHVVLMDLVMPKKNGVEATLELVEHNPKLRIIACSTANDESMILRALAAGCCHYVFKPFTSKNLVEAILKVGAEIAVS